jgi:hypothetical protein
VALASLLLLLLGSINFNTCQWLIVDADGDGVADSICSCTDFVVNAVAVEMTRPRR